MKKVCRIKTWLNVNKSGNIKVKINHVPTKRVYNLIPDKWKDSAFCVPRIK